MFAANEQSLGETPLVDCGDAPAVRDKPWGEPKGRSRLSERSPVGGAAPAASALWGASPRAQTRRGGQPSLWTGVQPERSAV